MITMPKELQQAVRDCQGGPIRLTDPETRAEYVLLDAGVYDKIRGLMYDDSPLTADDRGRLLLHAGLRAKWDDPEMDVYDDLDPRRQP